MSGNSRRDFFVAASSIAGIAVCRADSAKAQDEDAFSDQPFFSIGRRNNRWWLIDPEGNPQFSIGLNHIDPSALRHNGNASIWHKQYGNDMHRWLKESVRPNLKKWGFNCVGWNQEVVTKQPTNHRHSRSFTFEEYQSLDMPYCHMLPFSEIHQWESETKLPDFHSQGFADWCEHVAREHCSRFRDDPKLIGYWYSDCPVWVHTRRDNEWRGSLFDPDKLNTESGRRELGDLAARYYTVTREAIRRHDPNHLILGDRYEANAPLPEPVLRAAIPNVDVLSFQCFGPVERVTKKLADIAEKYDYPMLLADHAIPRRPTTPGDYSYHDPAAYSKLLSNLTGVPQVIGYHLCGAYVRNDVRRRGLLDENERPDTNALRTIQRSNLAVTDWVKTASKPQ